MPGPSDTFQRIQGMLVINNVHLSELLWTYDTLNESLKQNASGQQIIWINILAMKV